MTLSIKNLKDILPNKPDIYGIIFNIVGAIFIALSIGDIPCRGSTTCGDIIYKFAYILHPNIFWIGLFSMIFGFDLQLFDILTNKYKFSSEKASSTCIILNGLVFGIVFILLRL